MLRELTEEECRGVMEKGEFEPAVVNAAPSVAVILTQSWCPQWAAMKAYLPEVGAKISGSALFYIEYDRVPWFDTFRNFKETAFQNREIPYVRYYRQGQFLRDSNFISFDGFLDRLAVK
jgi:hypothetical protein